MRPKLAVHRRSCVSGDPVISNKTFAYYKKLPTRSSVNYDSENITSQLSSHLFWDVERVKIDLEKNKKWLVQRVLEYGLLKDWLIINKYYGISRIAEIAMQIKDLDEKSLAFISLLSCIPKESFLCYTTKQLRPRHWNF